MLNIDLLTRIVDSVLLHEPAGIIRELSASAAESLAICRVVARDRTLPYLLNQRDGTSNLTTGLHATATAVRETLSRSGHAVDNQQTDEDVMQISGAGHWFLEGWIGDHAVDFLVDSGSAVTAVSRSFFNTLSEAGAPVGVLRPTARRLRGANGSQIDISGCSSCVVSFLGLRTEFPILECNLSTDAIIGTDTLGSILPHTLDIKNGLLFTEGGVSLQLHRRDAALSGGVFTVGHCSIPPHSEAVLHCTTRTVGGRSLPPSGLLEGLTVFSENTGLVVGRTMVDPSAWKVPVLVSNFGQETVMVKPFSEIGMIAQVSAMGVALDDSRLDGGATPKPGSLFSGVRGDRPVSQFVE